MNLNSIEFSRAANSVITDGQVRGRVLAAAVAAAVARALPLPSSEVEDVNGHYRSAVAESARHYLSTINEEVVFDIRAAEPFLRALWIMRYSSAYPSLQAMSARQYGFFDTWCGTGMYVDEATHKFMNDHKDTILDLMYLAAPLVAEVQNG